jgi:hypothetical protein
VCFKYARARADFIQILLRWIDVVRDVTRAPNGLEALAQVMRYILEVNEHVGPEALLALLEPEIRPEAKEGIVTYAQQLREQGRQQGIEQGRQQAFREVLRRVLRQRFGDLDPRFEERIEAATIEELEGWSVRVVSVGTLAELFAD